MSITASLNAIRDLLSRETGLAAQVGVPSRAAEGLFVWPYRLVLTEARTALPRPPGALAEPPRTSVDIPLLVLARPSFTEAGLDALEAALQALMNTSVITLPDGEVGLHFDSRLGTADLATLFAAARLQPSPALELVARTTVARATPVS